MSSKKIMIIGKRGFIGSALGIWLKEMGYEVIQVSGREEEWKSVDMTGINTVVYAAGLAHTREKKGNQALFQKANVLQARESALRAKAAGVPQYIYISSMNVFGSAGKRIGANTPLAPDSLYGRSKRQGELEILKLETQGFATVIIRPPVVTGNGCKGNIWFLTRASKYIKFFPSYQNQRSTIDIINLCSFINCLIIDNARGIYHPQNEEYISTYQLLSLMVHFRGGRICPISMFNPLISWLLPRFKVIRKVFGDDCYEKDLSCYGNTSYCIRKQEEAIKDMITGTLK